MRKFGLLGTSALGSFTFIGLSLALASPAIAQTPAAEEDPEAQVGDSEAELQSGTQADVGAQGEGANTAAQDSGTITVTGSRIRRPNLESTVPITSIGGEQFFQQGQTNIGDTLNDLPQLRSTFAQQNPGLGIGIAGLNLLDLRGLGTQRTLVLVNGRRHVPADILNNAVSPDINTIPNDLIERVDIVTGGNSAIYGSDAIAGVVNFVLRRNFDGYQIRGQVGTTGKGFSGNQYVSLMAGRNFGGNRGNVTLHGEYARTDRVFASDVDQFRRQDNFIGIDLDPATAPFGGDGFPDTAFFTDIRSSTIHFAGLVPVTQKNVPNAGACGNATGSNIGGTNTAGTAFNCTYIFGADGRLQPQTGTRIGTSQNPVFLGGNGQTGREGRNVSILPFTERFNFNLLAHYSFSDAAEVFVEAKWNRVNALGNNAGPSFIQSQSAVNGSIGDFRERTRLDNPFLNPADRTVLANAILASGCRPEVVVVCPAAGNLTAAEQAAVTAGTFRFLVARNLLDVGLRDETFQRDTWRVVGGLRGTFNDDWSYEVSANYGKFKEDITTDGFIDRQRFSLAMDAGRNPVTGQIQCRSQFDPAAAVPLARTTAVDVGLAAQNAARLAADIAACVPYNPFGTADNSASIAYFARTFANSSGLTQLVLSGFVSGDSSQIFELPGGPVRFAVGAEYRRETAFYNQDQFVTDGFTNGVSIPDFEPDPFTVKEAFAEIQIPILKDVPFFEELTVSGAARVAKYQGGTGTVWSYNAGVDWSPIRDIRFRGNYSRAVRAPNVSETAFPLVPNFAPGFQDPCQPNNITPGNRATNCATQLGALLGGLSNVAPSLGIVSGSNVNLTAETSNSWTLGGVFQPRWVRGLSLSVDYFDIEVKDVIVSLTAQAIVNACYDQPTLDNVFCGQFQRNLTNGPGPNGENPGRIIENSLIVAPLNFASRRRKGVDVNFAYRRDFGLFDFNTNLIYTHQLTNANFQSATDPTFETRILNQLGDPKDEFRWDFDFGFDEFTLGYRMRYIGPQFITAYANLFPLNGQDPANIDAFPVQKYEDVMYHDIRMDFDLAKDENGNTLKFYVGVDNVLDRGVPRGATTATGAGSAIFSFRGRTFYGGFRARF